MPPEARDRDPAANHNQTGAPAVQIGDLIRLNNLAEPWTHDCIFVVAEVQRWGAVCWTPARSPMGYMGYRAPWSHIDKIVGMARKVVQSEREGDYSWLHQLDCGHIVLSLADSEVLNHYGGVICVWCMAGAPSSTTTIPEVKETPSSCP